VLVVLDDRPLLGGRLPALLRLVELLLDVVQLLLRLLGHLLGLVLEAHRRLLSLSLVEGYPGSAAV